jgi:hypothetical protein
VLAFSSLFIIHFSFFFFFLQGGGSVFPVGYAGLSQLWLGENHVVIGAHLLVCRMSPKQVWNQHLVV